ncbi:MAG: hypothetical protein DSY85_16750 [Marinomonas sp.]|nr:MAG: hypothetical protein DSY85_16750 [Marinomonas sp.]
MSRRLRANNSQRGTFVVEFAAISFALVLLMAFCGDLVIRLATKGKLDRMAYSAVTIVKERSALFAAEDFQLLDGSARQTQFDELHKIVEASLIRTMGSFNAQQFGMTLDVIGIGENDELVGGSNTLPDDQGIQCESSQSMQTLVTALKLDTSPTLYRITLCYETVNWFGGLLDEDYGMVRSHAISIGR